MFLTVQKFSKMGVKKHSKFGPPVNSVPNERFYFLSILQV